MHIIIHKNIIFLRGRSYIDPETGKELFQYYQYRATMRYPRPESYREDMELVKGLTSDSEKEQMW
jgi:hypothetical protein